MRFSSKVELPKVDGIRERPIVMELLDYSSTCGVFAKIEFPRDEGIRERSIPLELTVASLPESFAKIELPREDGIRERSIPMELVPIGGCGGLSWCTCFSANISGSANFGDFYVNKSLTQTDIGGSDMNDYPKPSDWRSLGYNESNTTTYSWWRSTFFFPETLAHWQEPGNSFNNKILVVPTTASVQQRGNYFYGSPWWLGSEKDVMNRGFHPIWYTEFGYKGKKSGSTDAPNTRSLDEARLYDVEDINGERYRGGGYFTDPYAHQSNPQTLFSPLHKQEKIKLDDEPVDFSEFSMLCNFYSPADVFVTPRGGTAQRAENDLNPKFALGGAKYPTFTHENGFTSSDPYIRGHYGHGYTASGFSTPLVGRGAKASYQSQSTSFSINNSGSYRWNSSGGVRAVTQEDIDDGGVSEFDFQGNANLGTMRAFGEYEFLPGFSESESTTNFPNNLEPQGIAESYMDEQYLMADRLEALTENTYYFILSLGHHFRPIQKEKDSENNTIAGGYALEEYLGTGWGLYLVGHLGVYGPYQYTDHLSKYFESTPRADTFYYKAPVKDFADNFWNATVDLPRNTEFTNQDDYLLKEKILKSDVKDDVSWLTDLISDFNKTPQELGFIKVFPENDYVLTDIFSQFVTNSFNPGGNADTTNTTVYEEEEKYFDNNWIESTPFGLSIPQSRCEKNPPVDFNYLQVFVYLHDEDGIQYQENNWVRLDWSFTEGKWRSMQDHFFPQNTWRKYNGGWDQGVINNDIQLPMRYWDSNYFSDLTLEKEGSEYVLKWRKGSDDIIIMKSSSGTGTPFRTPLERRFQNHFYHKDQYDELREMPASIQLREERLEVDGEWRKDPTNPQIQNNLLFTLSIVNPRCPEPESKLRCPPIEAKHKS